MGKCICLSFKATVVCNMESLEILPLRWKTRQGWPLSAVVFSDVLQMLASAVRQVDAKA